MYVGCPNKMKQVVNSSIVTFLFNQITTTTLNYIVLYPQTFRKTYPGNYSPQVSQRQDVPLEYGVCQSRGWLTLR